MNGCKERNRMMCTYLGDIPVFRYLKEPVKTISDLYSRYPDGGEYGWYSFVNEAGTFAYWNTGKKRWSFIGNVMNGEDISNVYIDSDGHLIFITSHGTFDAGEVIGPQGKGFSFVERIGYIPSESDADIDRYASGVFTHSANFSNVKIGDTVGIPFYNNSYNGKIDYVVGEITAMPPNGSTSQATVKGLSRINSGKDGSGGGSLNVVQETGTSTTSVMSQNATTIELLKRIKEVPNPEEETFVRLFGGSPSSMTDTGDEIFFAGGTVVRIYDKITQEFTTVNIGSASYGLIGKASDGTVILCNTNATAPVKIWNGSQFIDTVTSIHANAMGLAANNEFYILSSDTETSNKGILRWDINSKQFATTNITEGAFLCMENAGGVTYFGGHDGSDDRQGIYTLDPDTGEITLSEGLFDSPARVLAMKSDADGNLYVGADVFMPNDTIVFATYVIDTNTYEVSKILDYLSEDIAVSSSNTVVFAIRDGSGYRGIFVLKNGTLTHVLDYMQVGLIAAGNGTVYITDNYTVDVGTGIRYYDDSSNQIVRTDMENGSWYPIGVDSEGNTYFSLWLSSITDNETAAYKMTFPFSEYYVRSYGRWVPLEESISPEIFLEKFIDYPDPLPENAYPVRFKIIDNKIAAYVVIDQINGGII